MQENRRKIIREIEARKMEYKLTWNALIGGLESKAYLYESSKSAKGWHNALCIAAKRSYKIASLVTRTTTHNVYVAEENKSSNPLEIQEYMWASQEKGIGYFFLSVNFKTH